MIYKLALVVSLLGSPSALSLNCTGSAPGTLSDQWIIGTTIAAIAIGAVQVVGAFATFIADYIFYKKSQSENVLKLRSDLEELRTEHKRLKKEEPKIILIIFDEIHDFIKQNQLDIQDDEMIEILKHLKKVLKAIADDEGSLMEVSTLL